MAHERSETIRIIIAFGDISGFTNFVDSVTNDRTEYDPLMDAFDDIVDETAKKTGYSFQDTGDGFMCAVDVVSHHAASKAIEVLLNLWDLLGKIESLFKSRSKEFITPDGFRIVTAMGYVKRKIKNDGKMLLRGKHINRAHHALDIARGHGLACDLSLRHLIDDRLAEKHGLTFTPIADKLWSVSVSH